MIIRKGPMPAGWTALPNVLLEDGRISFKARGLLCYLLSRPEGWETDSERLASSRHSEKDGRDAIRTALQELVRLRYIVRVKTQNSKGHWSTSSFVYDEPQALEPENPPVDNSVHNPVDGSVDNQAPTTGFPTVGFSGAINNTKEQEIKRLPNATTEGAVDNSGFALGPASGSGNAALASGSPSAAAPAGAIVASGPNADELTLDPSERGALLRGTLVAPGFPWFELRSHLRTVWGVECTIQDAVSLVEHHYDARTLWNEKTGAVHTLDHLVRLALLADWSPPTLVAASGAEGAPRPSRE